MGRIKITLFLVLIFIMLTTNIGAYQGCDGQYTPYPVKCQGGGGSAYTGNQVNPSATTTIASETQPNNNSGINLNSLSWNYSLLETIWIIAGLLAIAYFIKRLFFRRRHHRYHRR